MNCWCVCGHIKITNKKKQKKKGIFSQSTKLLVPQNKECTTEQRVLLVTQNKECILLVTQNKECIISNTE